MLLLDLRKTGGPLYRRVYHALKSTIREGRLAPDARLPSTRELAADLRVSRNTVVLAYEQLLAEGYVVSRNRATASVASLLPTSAGPASSRSKPGNPPPVSAYARRLTALLGTPSTRSSRSGLRYDFRYGKPSIDEFPREIWRRLLAARARRPARDAFGYADPAGYPPLREALAQYLKRARGPLRGPSDRDHQRLAAGLRSCRARPARSRRRRGGRGAPLPRRHGSLRGRWRAAGLHAGRRRRTADAAAAKPGAGRVRHPLPSVPDRRHHAARAPARAARVGGPRRQLGDRGRLRQRVPLRGAPA